MSSDAMIVNSRSGFTVGSSPIETSIDRAANMFMGSMATPKHTTPKKTTYVSTSPIETSIDRAANMFMGSMATPTHQTVHERKQPYNKPKNKSTPIKLKLKLDTIKLKELKPTQKPKVKQDKKKKKTTKKTTKTRSKSKSKPARTVTKTNKFLDGGSKRIDHWLGGK
jgi:hypothetical protein